MTNAQFKGQVNGIKYSNENDYYDALKNVIDTKQLKTTSYNYNYEEITKEVDELNFDDIFENFLSYDENELDNISINASDKYVQLKAEDYDNFINYIIENNIFETTDIDELNHYLSFVKQKLNDTHKSILHNNKSKLNILEKINKMDKEYRSLNDENIFIDDKKHLLSIIENTCKNLVDIINENISTIINNKDTTESVNTNKDTTESTNKDTTESVNKDTTENSINDKKYDLNYCSYCDNYNNINIDTTNFEDYVLHFFNALTKK